MDKVLIVDDSAVDRRLAGRLVEKNGNFAISYANDGAEALHAFLARSARHRHYRLAVRTSTACSWWKQCGRQFPWFRSS